MTAATDESLVSIACRHCDGSTRLRPREDLEAAVALYVAHLVESHWDLLEEGRELVKDRAGHTAWTRL